MANVDRANAAQRRVDMVRHATLNNLFPSSRWYESTVVACGTPQQRSAVFYNVLYRAAFNALPVVVLYSSDETERQLQQFPATRFAGPASKCYMPLLGMQSAEALSVLCPDDGNRGWALSEWEALNRYLSIMPQLRLPIALRQLQWLVHLSRREFVAYLNSIPDLPAADRERICGETLAYYGGAEPVNRLIGERIGRIERAVAQDRIYDVNNTLPLEQCVSILSSVAAGGILAIRLDGNASRESVNVFCRELSVAKSRSSQLLLACCDITIPEGCDLANQMQNSGGNIVTFVSGEHIPNMFPSQRGDYWKGMLNGSILLFNCGSVGTAASYEDLFGTYQRKRVTTTQSASRLPFALFSTRGSGSVVTEETFPRITQEDLCSHPQGAIFCASGDNRISVISHLDL